jgi:plastocyanin
VFAADSKFFTANTNDPVLYLRRGDTYTFTNNAAGHPFEIRASNGGSAYSTGVTNNGGTGNIVFTVPMGAPATLYYQCTLHSGMGNTINIV